MAVPICSVKVWWTLVVLVYKSNEVIFLCLTQECWFAWCGLCVLVDMRRGWTFLFTYFAIVSVNEFKSHSRVPVAPSKQILVIVPKFQKNYVALSPLPLLHSICDDVYSRLTAWPCGSLCRCSQRWISHWTGMSTMSMQKKNRSCLLPHNTMAFWLWLLSLFIILSKRYGSGFSFPWDSRFLSWSIHIPWISQYASRLRHIRLKCTSSAGSQFI